MIALAAWRAASFPPANVSHPQIDEKVLIQARRTRSCNDVNAVGRKSVIKVAQILGAFSPKVPSLKKLQFRNFLSHETDHTGTRRMFEVFFASGSSVEHHRIPTER